MFETTTKVPERCILCDCPLGNTNEVKIKEGRVCVECFDNIPWCVLCKARIPLNVKHFYTPVGIVCDNCLDRLV